METSTIFWTAAGIGRLRDSVTRLKAAYRSHAAILNTARGGRLSTNEDRLSELNPICQDRDIVHTKLEDAERLLARVRAAPPVTQTDHIQVGSEVEVEYLDDCSRKKRGQRETFIIGGSEEVDEDSIVRTFSCSATFGRTLINKEVGDEVTIRPENSKSYRLEVIRIGIPASATASQTA